MAFLRAVGAVSAAWMALAPFATTVCGEQPGAFPYIAYVVSDQAAVRSGPGDSFYAAGDLARGRAVEVYRHDANGWCAIRPPEGSFSVVPVEALQVVGPRVAEVVAEGAAVRVGSRLTDQLNVVQVKLMLGERVEVLAPPRLGDPLVRIAPPSGEFRFVAAADLSREPPTEQTPQGRQPATTGSRWRAYGARHRDEAEPAIVVPDAASEAAASPRPLAPVTMLGANPAVPTRLADPIQIVPGSPAAVQPMRYEVEGEAAAQRPPAPASTSPSAPTAPAPAAQAPMSAATMAPAPSTSAGPLPRIRFDGRNVRSSVPVTREVAELQLDLSRAIVAPPQPWLLAGLREETTTALGHAQTATEREQLRELLARIVLLEEIANERARIAVARNAAARDETTPGEGSEARLADRAGAGMTEPTEPLDVFDAQAAAAGSEDGASPGASDDIRALVRRDLGLSNRPADDPSAITPTPRDAAEPSQYAGTEARYDAVGTLKPVVSRRSQAPQYALIDDNGQIAALITPSPDLNLQEYIGQRVGVVGSRGYMPEFRRAHVTATRVTLLEAGSGVLRR